MYFWLGETGLFPDVHVDADPHVAPSVDVCVSNEMLLPLVEYVAADDVHEGDDIFVLNVCDVYVPDVIRVCDIGPTISTFNFDPSCMTS